MINKKVMLFFVGIIVANIVDVEAMRAGVPRMMGAQANADRPNHPLGFGVMDSVSILRSEIDLLFLSHPGATSARDIVARLPDMQLGEFVERTGPSMYDLATRVHPGWGRGNFFFNGQRMDISSVLSEGGQDRSYPPFRALVVCIVELFEQAYPKNVEATAGGMDMDKARDRIFGQLHSWVSAYIEQGLRMKKKLEKQRIN
jgi:hypothetical protein